MNPAAILTATTSLFAIFWLFILALCMSARRGDDRIQQAVESDEQDAA